MPELCVSSMVIQLGKPFMFLWFTCGVKWELLRDVEFRSYEGSSAFVFAFDCLEPTNSVLAQYQCVHLKPFCSRELQRAPMDGFTAWLWMNVLVLGFGGAWVWFF